MFKRGLSPLISAVLLIAFVITLFVLISSWISSSVIEETTSKSSEKLSKALSSYDIQAKVNRATILDSSTVEVTIENTGTKTIDSFRVKVIGTKDAEIVDISTSVSELNVVTEDVVLSMDIGTVLSVEVYPVVDGETYSSSVGKKDVLPTSCLAILGSDSGSSNGNYDIYPDGINKVNVYCDMETDGGGWTLVWVGTGKTYTNALINSYVTSIKREDISKGISVGMQKKLIENWPYYTQVYYERWLPDSLTGRSYANPGWKKYGRYSISNTLTNMNFWSVSRTNTQGWDFSLGRVCGPNPSEPVHYKECHQMPNGNRKRHKWGCWGCASNYFWFQDNNLYGAWNGFFPDFTYGYWRITTGGDYNQQWAQYNALSEGNPMPGYGLYIR